MNITKYGHACLTLEKDDAVLIIDPGNLSSDFIAPANVVGVVVTHEHGDHFDTEQLAAIIDKNPDALIIAHPSITSQLEALPSISVDTGDIFDVGPFHLEFFGGQHAPIFANQPAIANLGVLVDDLFYYPGDSYAVPEERNVDTLALPVSAPWLKLSEVVDFLLAVRPRVAFPTHDALLSEIGANMTDRMMQQVADAEGIDYQHETRYTV